MKCCLLALIFNVTICQLLVELYKTTPPEGRSLRSHDHINYVLSTKKDMELLSPSEEKLELIQLVGRTPKLYPILPSDHPLDRPIHGTVQEIPHLLALNPPRHHHLAGQITDFDETKSYVVSDKTDNEDVLHETNGKKDDADWDVDLEAVETGEESLINADNQGIVYDMSHENSHYEEDEHTNSAEDKDTDSAVYKQRNRGDLKTQTDHYHINKSLEEETQTDHYHINKSLEEETQTDHYHINKSLEEQTQTDHNHISNSLETTEELLEEGGGEGAHKEGIVRVEGKSGEKTSERMLYAEEVASTKTTITLQFPSQTNAEEDNMALGHQICIVRLRDDMPLNFSPSQFVEDEYHIYDKSNANLFEVPLVMAEFSRKYLPKQVVIGNGVAYGDFKNGPLSSSSFYQVFVREIHKRSTQNNVEHFKATNFLRSSDTPDRSAVYTTKPSNKTPFLFLLDIWANPIFKWGGVAVLSIAVLGLSLCICCKCSQGRKRKKRKKKRKSIRSRSDLHVCSTNDTIPLLIATSSEEDDFSINSEEDAYVRILSREFPLESESLGIVKRESLPQAETGESLVREKIRVDKRQRDLPVRSMDFQSLSDKMDYDRYRESKDKADKHTEDSFEQKETESELEKSDSYITLPIENVFNEIPVINKESLVREEIRVDKRERDKPVRSMNFESFSDQMDYDRYRKSKDKADKHTEDSFEQKETQSEQVKSDSYITLPIENFSNEIPVINKEEKQHLETSNDSKRTSKMSGKMFANSDGSHLPNARADKPYSLNNNKVAKKNSADEKLVESKSRQSISSSNKQSCKPDRRVLNTPPQQLQKGASEGFAVEYNTQLNSNSKSQEGRNYEIPVTRSAKKNQGMRTDNQKVSNNLSYEINNGQTSTTEFPQRRSNKFLADIPECKTPEHDGSLHDGSQHDGSLHDESLHEEEHGAELRRLKSKARKTPEHEVEDLTDEGELEAEICRVKSKAHIKKTGSIMCAPSITQIVARTDQSEDTADKNVGSSKDHIPKSATVVLLAENAVFSVNYLKEHANVDFRLERISQDLETLREYEEMIGDLEAPHFSKQEFKEKYDVTKEELHKLNKESETDIDREEFRRIAKIVAELEKKARKEKKIIMQKTKEQNYHKNAYVSLDRNELGHVTQSLSEMHIKIEPDIHIKNDLEPETQQTHAPPISKVDTPVTSSQTVTTKSVESSEQFTPSVCLNETQSTPAFADASNQWSSQESVAIERLGSVAGRARNPYLDMTALRRYMSNEAHSQTDDSLRPSVPVKKKSFTKIRNKISNVFRNYAGVTPKDPPRRKHINLETGELESEESLSPRESDTFLPSSCDDCGGPAVIANVDEDVDIQELIRLVESVHLVGESTENSMSETNIEAANSNCNLTSTKSDNVTSDMDITRADSLPKTRSSSNTVKANPSATQTKMTISKDETVLPSYLESSPQKGKIGIKKRKEKLDKRSKTACSLLKEDKTQTKSKLKLCPSCKSCKNVGSPQGSQI